MKNRQKVQKRHFWRVLEGQKSIDSRKTVKKRQKAIQKVIKKCQKVVKNPIKNQSKIGFRDQKSILLGVQKCQKVPFSDTRRVKIIKNVKS